MPFTWGDVPVRIAERLGEQVGAAEKAFRNVTAPAASRAIFGKGRGLFAGSR
jgi:hypothetical protein